MIRARSSKSRILITGGSGFIGSNFLRHISGTRDISIIAPRHNELDVLNIDQLEKTFEEFCPNVVINFAAHRDANSAEKQRGDRGGSVWNTNVRGVANISRVSSAYGSFLIHISTDMVFSGGETNKGPYSETMKPEKEMNYLSWYGWTKAEAERILAKNTNAAVIRIGNVTQPIYDPKLDYVGKIIFLFDHRQLYPLFYDQYLTLTSIPLLCQVIEAIIIKKRPGIYHVASKDRFTPYELGTYLIKKMYGEGRAIKRMSISSYLAKIPNRYPQYGGLLAFNTENQLGVAMPDWREIIDLSLESFHE